MNSIVDNKNLLYLFVFLILLIFAITKFVISKYLDFEQFKEFILKVSNVFTIKVDISNKILEVDDMFVYHTNYIKEMIQKNTYFYDLLASKDDYSYNEFIVELSLKGQASKIFEILTFDKKLICVLINAKAIKKINGQLYYLFVGRDIVYKNSNIKKSISDVEKQTFENNFIKHTNPDEIKIREFENRHKFLVDSLNIGMVEYNLKDNKIFFSEKCKKIFFIEGDCNDDAVKNIIINKIYKEDYYKMLKNIHLIIIAKHDSFKYNFRVYDEENSIRWIEFFGKFSYDEAGEITNFAGSFNDITNAWIYQEKIKHYAYFDTLTGLNNRTSMQEIVDSLLKSNPNLNSGLIFLDIDDFKFINDSFGHSFGDKLICQIVNRIKSVSGNYIIGRFNGDEIAIFIQNYENINELEEYMELLLETLSINYSDADICYKISASIGISLFPKHGGNFEELLKKADIAMNNVKQNGKNNYIIFTENMNIILQDRILLENDLRRAINEGSEIIIYLQPQYNLKSGNLHGFEVLTRWTNLQRGVVSPNIFIPLAEKTRLIVPLGKWILYESCKILKNFENLGFMHLKISVNLSPVQLIDNNIVNFIKNTVLESKIKPQNLELEITETALMENFDTTIKKLHELRAIGISIILDDFGTGYSSLTYLKTIPITSIKIDKSFIKNIETSSIDRAITKKIIDLSHILNLKTIVEGVETKEQLKFVKSIGCDVLQGYIGGRPVDRSEVDKILKSRMNL